MLKDPLDKEENPYDILGIPEDTTLEEVNQALPRFMRKVKNVTKIAKAQSALKKLKNLQERITIDLMYYSVEILDNFQVEENTDIRNLIPRQVAIPVFESTDFFIDLYKENLDQDYTRIEYKEIELKEIGNYNQQKDVKLYMPLDVV